jgi:hypothetical protein
MVGLRNSAAILKADNKVSHQFPSLLKGKLVAREGGVREEGTAQCSSILNKRAFLKDGLQRKCK